MNKVLEKNVPLQRFYIIKSWKRIGLQTIYYGGNERNVSNIVWAENPAYDGAKGIASMTNDESHKTGDISDLQGRRVDTPTHGLYIVNGKKVWVK